jgi:uncharacterized protein YkwD
MTMTDEWLQLTEEDITRAHALARSHPPMPDVISISSDDIPTDNPTVRTSSQVLTITSDDLAPAAPQPTTSAYLRQLETMMFDMVNQARKAHLPNWVGTAYLKWHEGLTAVSRGHSADMLKRQYVAHVTPEGVTAGQRLGNHGVRYVACGENIGVFYGDEALSARAIREIFDAFMNQPRSLTNHRGNILNPVWTHIGIGIAHNPAGSLVATQNFISAPAARIRGK